MLISSFEFYKYSEGVKPKTLRNIYKSSVYILRLFEKFLYLLKKDENIYYFIKTQKKVQFDSLTTFHIANASFCWIISLSSDEFSKFCPLLYYLCFFIRLIRCSFFNPAVGLNGDLLVWFLDLFVVSDWLALIRPSVGNHPISVSVHF